METFPYKRNLSRKDKKMKKRILLCSLAFLTGSCSSLNNVTFNVQDNNPLEFNKLDFDNTNKSTLNNYSDYLKNKC